MKRRRILLSSVLALLLVAAPAAALPFDASLLTPGWLTSVLDDVLGLVGIEKTRADNDPNGQPEDAESPVVPEALPSPDLSAGPGTA